MDRLEPHVYSEIQDIVEKLQKLDCTLLGNKNDAWIMELLFESGIHRWNLIQWLLSKLRYDVEPTNSTESKIKKLKSTLLEWGICKDCNVIEGTATVKEQLQFWSSIVDIIWTKYEITLSTSMVDIDDEIFVSPEKFIDKRILREYKKACSSVNKLVESGNLQHLFKSDLQFAPDVESEVKNISFSELEVLETLKSQSLIEKFKEDNKQTVALNIYKKLCDSKFKIDDNEDPETELNELEKEMLKISTELQNISGTFNDVYEDLEPLILNAKADDFIDVGPAFLKVEPLLKDLSELSKTFPKLESTNLILPQVNSELKDLLSQDTLTADDNYANTFKLLKDKN